MPDKFYTFGINDKLDRTIITTTDEHGFSFIPVVAMNTENNKEFTTKAIIDTGAAYCLLQPDFIDFLELQPIKSTEIHHPQHGFIPSSDYMLDLCIDIYNEAGSVKLNGVRVGILNAKGYPAGMIIGVELLRYYNFIYNGREKNFELRVII